MTNAFVLPRKVIIFAVVLPVAALLGYMLATPDSFESLALVGAVATALLIPLFLSWHRPLLVLAWNANITVFFLPGAPPLWLVMVAVSLTLTVLACFLDKEIRFQQVPSVTWTLLALALVVIITAKMTGGIGLRAFGSRVYGGKKLILLLGAILGYFALSSQAIPIEKGQRYGKMYFLSAMTAVISNLIYLGGPSLWFLFMFFPVDNAMAQVLDDFVLSPADTRFDRMPGVAVAGSAAFNYMLVRYGVQGILDLRKPWRLLLCLGLLTLSLLGGFRSVLIMFILVLVIQFYCEGLHRTRLFMVVGLTFLVGSALLVPFASKLPLSMQRSLSVLPLDIDPAARADAQGSLEWRLEMWRMLLDEVPHYLWLGKGYAINPTDIYLMDQAVRHGLAGAFEGAMVSGDYHSGPLSILVPFGVFGVVTFIAFLIAAGRVLILNYRYGDPRIKNINTFILSYFSAKVVFYFLCFGAFNVDMAAFAGLVGLSVALNRGVAKRPEETKSVAAGAAVASTA
jgi:O-antigen ligase/polysaccharide polymerase Wzy-like membrane protein